VLENENLITPAQGGVGEEIPGSHKLSSSSEVQYQNKTFKQTSYVLNILCTSRKNRNNITNGVKILSGIFFTTTGSYCRDSSSLLLDNIKFKAMHCTIYAEMF